MNHRACHLLGTVADRLMARRFLLFVTPAFRPAAAEWLAQFPNDEAPQSIELDLFIDSGTPLSAQFIGRVSPIDGQSYRLPLLDAAERDRPGQAAAEQQRRASGLGSIRSQAARLGGQLRISSQPKCGTAISSELPTDGPASHT